MTAVRPPLEPIHGRFISLQPLRTDQLVALHGAIGHPLVFAGGYGGGPAAYRADAAEFAAWARGYLRFGAEPRQGVRTGVRLGSRRRAIDSSGGDANVFAVRLHGGAHDGVLVGTTTLGDIDVERESAHIGWSAFDPRVWGSQVNAEAKLLLLNSAFEHGFGRVKIQADVMNTRSRAAIERLGARYEGTVRRERRRPDGSWRDTVLYSILAEEWPEVRDGLHERLSRFAGPVEFRSAEALLA
ncbi:RimJ/RimL family protein N-acetyltransferase [Microterricola gilva]|uniref:RimJ/RimL family protein N-acetyltransferase n=1 Tax=Microterricola gilva TaxID=393267 RepID=A0A4Q8AIR1_9MICO|nr:GNAT family protein [Microterricola gilva]RZU63831.1 RimJ/RimL family protein N-acetyltransferase [Microterricola gilva]